MTVVDHTSRVPPLDAAALARLTLALDREGVAAAFLFGSRARGEAGPLSDVDLAIVHAPDLGPAAAHALRLDLARAAGAALDTGEVDVVLANDASPLLRHRIVRDGSLLLDRDPSLRVSFQVAALRDYLDTAPLREELRRSLHRRLREGRFGRR